MKRTIFPISIKILLLCALTLGSVGGVGAEGSGISTAPKPAFTQINFNTYTPTPFGNEDVNPTMSIVDGGNTLHLSGNSWKKISLPYTVTANTVLEFDFKSGVQGEVQGIGFDNNETASPGYTYKLFGTQNWSGSINVHYYKYQTFAPGWRHYRIPVGEYYTGNMQYMVFANDHDVSNPTAESYFSNVRVFEDPEAAVQPPVAIDLDNYTISPYAGNAQSPALSMSLEEDGNALHMSGNGWLKMAFPYLVTESTIMEFDFKSDSQGEIHGIGFDDNNSEQENRTFSLYGTQNWGMDAFRYSLYASDWKHYRIPVGKYYTGMMKYIFFGNDHDVSSPTAESQFKNLSIYEGEVSLPLTVDFNQYAISPYYSTLGGGVPPTISIEDNGNTLHLSGNGWTQISMPIQVASDTVLEFDFKSTAQGEIHAIGFDTNQSSDTTNTFKLYGTQDYGNIAFHDYASSAPGWKHYVIPIGQYISSGQQLYLFFANDHDIANPTAVSYFSNVQIHSQPLTPTPIPTLPPTPTLTPPPSSGYNRSAAVAYAEQWAHSRNSAFGNVLPPGENYDNCGCVNCTNFMSQVFLAGGLPLIGDSPYDWPENWWYTSTSSSLSWRYVPTFIEHYQAHPERFEVVNDESMLEPGDIIILDQTGPLGFPDGVYDHIRVVIGHGATSDNPNEYLGHIEQNDTCHIVQQTVPTVTYDLLINQNCVDRKHVAWDYGININAPKILIHIID